MSGNAPQRKINPEKVSAQQQALRNEIVSGNSSSSEMNTYLSSLKLRRDLGLISEEEIKQLVGQESNEEVLCRKILINLNKLNTLDSRWLAISAQFGTDKLKVIRELASRYTKSSYIRNLTAMAIGQSDVTTFGQAEVNASMGSAARPANPAGPPQ